MHPHHFLHKPRIYPRTLKKGMTVEDLVSQYSQSGAFNGGRLAEACRLYERMLDENTTIALTLAGAMTPAGMGGPIITMLEYGFIDFIISTGANLYHDLHFALDLPVHQGDFRANDDELFEAGIVRIYDVFITDELLFATDAFLQEIFFSLDRERPISTAELHFEIGQAVLRQSKHPEYSLVAQAAKYHVPIYTSSPGDSSIGMNLAATKLRGHRLTVDPDLDVIETSALVYTSEKNGAIVVGGGSPKNFYLQTQPTLSQILKLDRGGQDFFIQITTDAPHWGGLSGATPQEAVSWGKIHPGEASKHVVVYSDSTVALPILFSYLCSVREPRPRKQLYLKREEAVNTLKRACQVTSSG